MQFDRKLIVGVEAELGLVTKDTLGYFSPSTLRLPSQFRSNGARIYRDGAADGRDRLEIATPESRNPLVAVTALQGSLDLVATELPENVCISLNNVDVDSKSWGTHENYLCTQAAFNRRSKIAWHLASRIIFTGAGFYKGPQLQFSSRMNILNEEQSNFTTSGLRPLVNDRDEPHASRFKRLHVISGESNILDAANFLKLGTTAIVLKLIEDGKLPDIDLPDGSPLQFGKTLNESAARYVELKTERSEKIPEPVMQAILIQEAYLNAAKEVYHDEKQDWFLKCLQYWEYALYACEHNFEGLIGFTDWASKVWMRKQYRDHPKDYPKVQGKDMDTVNWAVEMAYSIYGENAPVDALYQSGDAPKLVSSGKRIIARCFPPRGTRAYARGHAIRAIKSSPDTSPYAVDWESVTFSQSDVFEKLRLDNPEYTYRGELKRVLDRFGLNRKLIDYAY